MSSSPEEYTCNGSPTIRKSAALFLVAGSLFGFPVAVAADSEGPDFSSVMRRAYATEASNDAARLQWQRDLRQWALNAELNRMRAIGIQSDAKARHPNLAALFFTPKRLHAYELLSHMAADAGSCPAEWCTSRGLAR